MVSYMHNKSVEPFRIHCMRFWWDPENEIRPILHTRRYEDGRQRDTRHIKVERSVSFVIPLKNLPDFMQGQRENTFANMSAIRDGDIKGRKFYLNAKISVPYINPYPILTGGLLHDCWSGDEPERRCHHPHYRHCIVHTRLYGGYV